MSEQLDAEALRVLRRWFGDLLDDPTDRAAFDAQSQIWWAKDEAFDEALRHEFGALWERACAGALDGWAERAEGRLALVILLDQFTRNLCRGEPESWAQDDKAQQLTLEGLERGHAAALPPALRVFLLMPLMHAEDREMQRRACRLFEQLPDECAPQLMEPLRSNHSFAIQHAEIVERFGRFPHRNAILGRESTPEELAFLEEPGSSF